VPIAVPGSVKAFAVIAHSEQKRTIRHLKLNLGFRAAGMLDEVVDALLENQKDFTTNVRPESYIHICIGVSIGRAKSKGNIARAKGVAGETSHSQDQIAQMVFLRIDGPDDVASSNLPFLPRRWRSSASGSVNFRIIRANSLAHDFAEEIDLRQARANVVVQIGGDAPAHLFKFDKSLLGGFFAKPPQLSRTAFIC